jgi:hypothetical protein
LGFPLHANLGWRNVNLSECSNQKISVGKPYCITITSS